MRIDALGIRPVSSNYYGPDGIGSIASFKLTVVNGSAVDIPSGSFSSLLVSYGSPAVTASYAGDDAVQQATLLPTVLPGESAETIMTYAVPLDHARQVTVEVQAPDGSSASVIYRGSVQPAS